MDVKWNPFSPTKDWISDGLLPPSLKVSFISPDSFLMAAFVWFKMIAQLERQKLGFSLKKQNHDEYSNEKLKSNSETLYANKVLLGSPKNVIVSEEPACIVLL